MFKILVVDDDATSLFVAKACLKRWDYYEARTVSHPLQVLSILDENEEKPYDLVLADVHMPDMNGFELVEHVNAKFNIPVVLISADDKADQICRGLLNGALAYLLKPITADHVKHIWQYSELWKNKERDTYRRISQASVSRSINFSSTSNRDIENKPKKKKSKEYVWTPNLHNRLVEVMLILGPHDAVPKNILKMMNVQSITREQVASHLQKFRKFLTSILDGNTTLDETSNTWIDRHYYSRIVGGNPNQILLDQLFEKRRTGKSADPIRAYMPLPPYNEAESSSSRKINIASILMSNNHTSSVNAAGIDKFTLKSFVNIDTPILGQGGINLQRAENVSMPTPTHGSIIHFQSAGSLKNLRNILGRSTTCNNPIQNLNYEANNIGYYDQNTMVPHQHYLANTDSQIGNVQLHHGPNIHSSFGTNQFRITSETNEQLVNAGHGQNFTGSSNRNQFGYVSGANQQLRDFQIDPNNRNTVGGTNEFENDLDMMQFHGGEVIRDQGLFINNHTKGDSHEDVGSSRNFGK